MNGSSATFSGTPVFWALGSMLGDILPRSFIGVAMRSASENNQ
jgi:hypothetical protein